MGNFMKLYFEEEIREETVIEVAGKITAAARTAPKSRGIDNTVIALIKKEGIKEISDKIKEMAKRDNLAPFFTRDANNILSAEAMVLLGTKIAPLNLTPCGMCGFENLVLNNFSTFT